MAQKDKIEKILLDFNDVFADIVNVLIAKKDFVSEDELESMPTEHIFKAETEDYTSQFRDVVKLCRKWNVAIALIGFENQSVIDKWMLLRTSGYDGASYKKQYDHLHNNILDNPYPVITITLNFSMTRWKDKYKQLYDVISIPDELKPFVNNYRLNVIDVAFLEEDIRKQLKSDFKIIADFLYDKRTKGNKFKGSDDTIKHIAELLDFLRIFTNDIRYSEYKEEFLMQVRNGKEPTMCNVLDGFYNQGLEQGSKAERLRAIQNLLSKECSEEFILSLSYTSEEIEKAKQELLIIR